MNCLLIRQSLGQANGIVSLQGKGERVYNEIIEGKGERGSWAKDGLQA
jgi:hypothetical protein